MKRPIVTSGVFLLVGCSSPPTAKAPPKPEPPKLPALAVHKEFHQQDDKGFIKPSSYFAVVLNRAVEPVGDALEVIDGTGKKIPGETTWVSHQLFIFHPSNRYSKGAELRLRLAASLRAHDGSTLGPGELARAAMPPIPLLSASPHDPNPMDPLRLLFEWRLPAADVQMHGLLTVDGAPLEFVAVDEGGNIAVRPTHGFPPGKQAQFAWKEGPLASTSIGAVALDPIAVKAKPGFKLLRAGEPSEHCVRDATSHYRCASGRVTLTFATPISDEELELHTHPKLTRATFGDERGYRFYVMLPNKKPVTVVLDAGLTDTFGQVHTTKSTLTFVVE